MSLLFILPVPGSNLGEKFVAYIVFDFLTGFPVTLYPNAWGVYFDCRNIRSCPRTPSTLRWKLDWALRIGTYLTF